MKKITLTIGVVGLLSSCGIQFGDYQRWKQVNGNKNICESVEELRYYVQEDVWNGNLDSTVAIYYMEELNNICARVDESCHNCDEID